MTENKHCFDPKIQHTSYIPSCKKNFKLELPFRLIVLNCISCRCVTARIFIWSAILNPVISNLLATTSFSNYFYMYYNYINTYIHIFFKQGVNIFLRVCMVLETQSLHSLSLAHQIGVQFHQRLIQSGFSHVCCLF